MGGRLVRGPPREAPPGHSLLLATGGTRPCPAGSAAADRADPEVAAVDEGKGPGQREVHGDRRRQVGRGGRPGATGTTDRGAPGQASSTGKLTSSRIAD